MHKAGFLFLSDERNCVLNFLMIKHLSVMIWYCLAVYGCYDYTKWPQVKSKIEGNHVLMSF